MSIDYSVLNMTSVRR